MAIGVLGPVNRIINQTASEILQTGVTRNVQQVLQRLIESSFDVVDEVLKRVAEMTKEAEGKEPEKGEGAETKPEPGRPRKRR